MADENVGLQQLLTRTADAAGRFDPPPVGDLVRRRSQQSRSRARLAVAASVAAVVVVAAGLAYGGGHRADSSATSDRAKVLALAGPQGPGVSVSALRDYRWSALPAAPIAQRSSPASAWTGQQLLVWGGQGPDDTLYGDGAAYDPSTRTWVKLPPAPISPRVDMVSAWVDGSFIVWGGYPGDQGKRAVDGARYDGQRGSWTKLAKAPVTSYGWAWLVVAGGQAVLLSTSPDATAGPVRADVYDVARNRWRALPDLPSQPNQELFTANALGSGDTVVLWRYWAHETTVTSNSQGIETTGSGGEDTFALNVRSGRWTPVALDPDASREAFQELWTGRLLLFPQQDFYCGTCHGKFTRGNPGLAIDPRTGRRTPIPTGPVTSNGTTYVWTGSALLGVDFSTLIGDENNHPILKPGDTAAWDPDTNRWTSLRDTTIRGNANGAVTAWTGRELLVWGVTGLRGRAPAPATGFAFGPG